MANAGLLVGLVALAALASKRRGRPAATAPFPVAVSASGGRVEVVSTAAGWWVIGRASTLGVVLGGDAPQLAGVAVASGPMFDSRGPERLVLDVARGVRVETRHPTEGRTLAVVEGLARVSSGAGLPAGATVAVQGYPSLVEDGRPVACQEGERGRRRLAWAVMDGSRVALVGVVGTMWTLRAELVRGGAREAAYLDGGGASEFRAPGGPQWRHEARERPAAWVLLGA